ncbi:Thioredoxin [Arachis hypogaea]|nr:Thioredoxin [Arachis hypogaea]
MNLKKKKNLIFQRHPKPSGHPQPQLTISQESQLHSHTLTSLSHSHTLLAGSSASSPRRQCLFASATSVSVFPAACLCRASPVLPQPCACLPLLPPSSSCWLLCKLPSAPLGSSALSRQWSALQRRNLHRLQVGKPSLTLFLLLLIVLGLITGRHRMEKGLSSITTSSNKEGLPLTPHSNFKTASTDDDLAHILFNIKSSKTSAVINYGASWCRVCSEILPAFHRLSNNFPKLSFVYADIDECPETTQHIRYTPTFQFFRDGEKVDEMYGAGEERLRDRAWLHS